MPDLIRRGNDSSGRPILLSAEAWAVYDQAVAALGFTPTIVQGGWQAGAGASASAGTHEGDALDLRTWDRTADEKARMVRVFREHAWAYWERYATQGFDPHAHMIPGPWAHPAPQALDQWRDYLAGRDGLASHGPDYHLRPNPLVTTPPEADDMFSDADRATLAELVAKVDRLDQARANQWKRDQKIAKAIRDARAALAKQDNANAAAILAAVEADE